MGEEEKAYRIPADNVSRQHHPLERETHEQHLSISSSLITLGKEGRTDSSSNGASSAIHQLILHFRNTIDLRV
jgi:hypothetical protein